MDLKPTKPMSGFIELLPLPQRCFDECARRMQSVLRTAGFAHLDLPSIERAEVLTDKENFDEIETQMFMFQKGDTKMGLRYDGTVGLARYVAGHISDLTFPCRAYQFAKNYRGERPQRGRYREFYQMDLDILGIEKLSENYDAEIITVLANAYASVSEFIGPVKIRIGDRKFWDAFFEYLGLTKSEVRAAFVLIDKKDKLPDFIRVISDEIGAQKAVLINKVFTDGYRSFLNKNVNLDAAINGLDDFIKKLRLMGAQNVEIDLGIMRGHAYYTGVVFEFFLCDFPELGAVGGGGRYDDLASKFSKTKIVGVGAAVGFSRLMVALLDDNKIDLSCFENNITAAILVIGENQTPFAMSVLSQLRAAEIVAVPYLDTDKKFKNQIEFANKINAKFSVIIGEDEVKSQTVSVKNMTSGEQVRMTVSDTIKTLKNIK